MHGYIATDPTTTRQDSAAPRWMRTTLWLAAAYNLVWGTVVILAPNLFFDAIGADRPRYAGIWQCVGMIVGVYGIGYGIAATDPARHWPIVFVGLLGKVFGPIGFLVAASRGDLPVSFGWTLPTNDLVWWLPFVLILWHALRVGTDPAIAGGSSPVFLPDRSSPSEALRERLRVLGAPDAPRKLVLLLRHAGCVFCTEALSDLARSRSRIEACDIQIVLVCMEEAPPLTAALDSLGLNDVPLLVDPSAGLYRVFGLERGSFRQLFGWRTLVRGASAFWSGHRVGRLAGDGLQMPGAFFIDGERIARSQRAESAGDRLDFDRLVEGEAAPAA